MNFTFGIITNGKSDSFIESCVSSIRLQKIEKYEIIIVGKTSFNKSYDTTILEFDENIKPAWITRKKNIICQMAKYDNIVLMHDYFIFDLEWYSGFLKFGDDFDICINQIKTKNEKRFRDFCLFPPDMPKKFQEKALLPYYYKQSTTVNKLMYISGAFYIVKKNIALKYPLNENLSWGQGEDYELCKRLSNDNVLIKVNENSIVRHQKNVGQAIWEVEVDSSYIEYLNSLG